MVIEVKDQEGPEVFNHLAVAITEDVVNEALVKEEKILTTRWKGSFMA